MSTEENSIMKATSLTVNLMSSCNAKCPFCISKLTHDYVDNATRFWRNEILLEKLPKALAYARYHGVDTVLITSSGEPTLRTVAVETVCAEVSRAGIPIIELQTNGALFQPGTQFVSFLDRLSELGVNTIAVSVSSMDAAKNAEIMGRDYDWKASVRSIVRRNFMCRVSLNLIKGEVPIGPKSKLEKWLMSMVSDLRESGVHQFTLRDLGIPAVSKKDSIKIERVRNWIEFNKLPSTTSSDLVDLVRRNGTKLRPLPHGGFVYDIGGLSTVVTDCMTDTQEDSVRSLILQPDGGLYHSWNYKGSRIL